MFLAIDANAPPAVNDRARDIASSRRPPAIDKPAKVSSGGIVFQHLAQAFGGQHFTPFQ